MADRQMQRAAAERFAANLRRLRETGGLNQQELAFRADIHRTQVNLIEGGHRAPRLDTLIKLAGALGVTANDLVDGIEWRPNEQLKGGFDVSPDAGSPGA